MNIKKYIACLSANNHIMIGCTVYSKHTPPSNKPIQFIQAAEIVVTQFKVGEKFTRTRPHSHSKLPKTPREKESHPFNAIFHITTIDSYCEKKFQLVSVPLLGQKNRASSHDGGDVTARLSQVKHI